jgi:purine nucleosidase
VKKVVLDMDTGVDDAFAIALALNSSELDVLAITTVAGNAPVAACTRNCLLLGELLRPDDPPPVAEGAARPLEQGLLTAPEVHGLDGLGGSPGTLPVPSHTAIDTPAHELLVALAREHPGEITLVATGPLTNVARAIATDPDAMAGLARVVAMGGAFHVPGNTGPVAEFNLYVDPEAARVVLGSALDVTLVPLDATTRWALTRQEVERRPLWGDADDGSTIAAGTGLTDPKKTLAAILRRALDYYMRFQFCESRLDGGYMHDPLAVAAAINAEILTTSPGAVYVAARGDRRGQTTMHLGPPGAHEIAIAFDLDENRFSTLLTARILSPIFG